MKQFYFGKTPKLIKLEPKGLKKRAAPRPPAINNVKSATSSREASPSSSKSSVSNVMPDDVDSIQTVVEHNKKQQMQKQWVIFFIFLSQIAICKYSSLNRLRFYKFFRDLKELCYMTSDDFGPFFDPLPLPLNRCFVSAFLSMKSDLAEPPLSRYLILYMDGHKPWSRFLLVRLWYKELL